MGRKPVLTRVPNQIQHEEEPVEPAIPDREPAIEDETYDQRDATVGRDAERVLAKAATKPAVPWEWRWRMLGLRRRCQSER